MKHLLTLYQQQPYNFFCCLIDLMHLIQELNLLIQNHPPKTISEYFRDLFPRQQMTFRIWFDNICDTCKVFSNHKKRQRMEIVETEFPHILQQVWRNLTIHHAKDFHYSTESVYLRSRSICPQKNIPFDLNTLTHQSITQLLTYKYIIPKYMKKNLKDRSLKNMAKRFLLIKEMEYYANITDCLELIHEQMHRISTM